MSLQEWERDVCNRQRNIVFPDTILNEGRFYRNIVYGKAVFSVGQKMSLMFLVLYFLTITCVALAGTISDFRSAPDVPLRDVDLWVPTYALGNLLFWSFLAIKGFLPSIQTRTIRADHRRSRRP